MKAHGAAAAAFEPAQLVAEFGFECLRTDCQRAPGADCPSCLMRAHEPDAANVVFPSLELYPLHDKDGFPEFALGLWFNTRELVGKPDQAEVRTTLLAQRWPHARIDKIIETLARHEQIEVPF